MAGMWGADTERLRELGRAFDEGAAGLRAVRDTLDAAITEASWRGPDATEFCDQWHGTLQEHLGAAITALEDNSAKVLANAEQQEVASQADDGAGLAPMAAAGAMTGGAARVFAAGVAPVPDVPVPGKPSPIAEYESALREAGLLPPRDTEPLYWEWLENAADQGVDPKMIVAIARDFDIGPEDFELLAEMTPFKDPEGKKFFLLPTDISGEDAQKAALMTYIFNARTDYGNAPGNKDFPDTPYSALEVQRIIDRQEKNSWSYSEDVAFVHTNGGRLVTTPNGMLMGAGGSWNVDQFSRYGGTTWGDIFMLNFDKTDTPAQAMRDEIIGRGKGAWQKDGEFVHSELDLDRLLHHEERHSQQWAQLGRGRFMLAYLASETDKIGGGKNRLEKNAGLADGGYE